MEDEASCSEPDWRWKLEEMGFSSSQAAEAVERLEKGGQQVTLTALVNSLYDEPNSHWPQGAPGTPEDSMDSDDSMDWDDYDDAGADSETGAEVDGGNYGTQDSRWRDLEQLGYSDDLISVALSYCRSEGSVEEVLDWIEAYQLKDVCPPKQKESSLDAVVKGVKAVLGQLQPVYEEAIRKSGCQDVGEALDLIEAFKQHSNFQNVFAEVGADGMDRDVRRGGERKERRIAGRRVREESRVRAVRRVREEGLVRHERPVREERAVRHERRVREQKKRRAIIGEVPWKTLQESYAFLDAQAGATGFGVPGRAFVPRQLRSDLARPPYFYFENVAALSQDDWNLLSTALYGIKPEFVDSVHFSACKRRRGYIHNLPVEGRKLIIPQPPMSIQELLPDTCGRHWPAWDTRQKILGIHARGSHENVLRITGAVKQDGERIWQDGNLRQETLADLERCNLIWTGPNQLSVPTVEEVEEILGFERYHTRGIVNRSDVWRALLTTFQVNTVAYHLSVLEPMFPMGMNVISLFSGIGGAEVALHKLKIRINTLVVVEKDITVRQVIINWWKSTKQKGNFVDDIDDVQNFTREKLAELTSMYGRFDLLIGASPLFTANPTGGGEERALFGHFHRILTDLRS